MRCVIFGTSDHQGHLKGATMTDARTRSLMFEYVDSRTFTALPDEAESNRAWGLASL